MNFLQDDSAIVCYKEQINAKYAIDTSALEWRSFLPGECMYEQGYPLPFLSFLVKGKVKIHTTTEDGKQLIVAFNKPLELFGDIELVQQADTLHTIEAVTAVHVAVLPTVTARSWRKDAHFNEVLLQSISRKFLTKSSTLSFHIESERNLEFQT